MITWGSRKAPPISQPSMQVVKFTLILLVLFFPISITHDFIIYMAEQGIISDLSTYAYTFLLLSPLGGFVVARGTE